MANYDALGRLIPDGQAEPIYNTYSTATGEQISPEVLARIKAQSAGNPWSLPTSLLPGGSGAAPVAGVQQASPNSWGGGSTNLGLGGKVSPQATTTSPTTSSGGSNPYLADMGKNIMAQMTDNFTRNQLPALRSGAVAAGGFGGSRQGVVEANGLRDLNLGIGQNLTNLYGTDWTNQQNRDLSYAGLDSQNAQFGANYGLNVLNAQNNWANQGVNATTQMQNTPTQYQTMFGNQQNNIAGQGGTNTSTQNMPGNPWLGALGGFQLANQYYK